MFAYDWVNDEYGKVFDIGDNICNRSMSTTTSYKSTRSSIRSLNSSPARIITKRGRINTFQIKRPKKNFIYFRDLGNTLLNIRWRWITIALFIVNLISFFVFGLMWMWIAHASGDFDDTVDEVCIVNTKTFTGYVLLSVETMLTIGYGYRYPTEKCLLGWTVPLLQALVSIGIQGALVSAIYVKISKPITKNFMRLFSQRAVICLRDGKLCFIIRITDTSGKIAVGTTIKMYFVNKNESDVNYFQIQRLHVEPHGFPIFPFEVVHVIDAKSPFYKLDPETLLISPMEVIVVAEGISIITAQASQNRVSYTNSEILWGHRFGSCVTFDSRLGKYVVDYKRLNDVYRFDTPLCSVKMLNTIAKSIPRNRLCNHQ